MSEVKVIRLRNVWVVAEGRNEFLTKCYRVIEGVAALIVRDLDDLYIGDSLRPVESLDEVPHELADTDIHIAGPGVAMVLYDRERDVLALCFSDDTYGHTLIVPASPVRRILCEVGA